MGIGRPKGTKNVMRTPEEKERRSSFVAVFDTISI